MPRAREWRPPRHPISGTRSKLTLAWHRLPKRGVRVTDGDKLRAASDVRPGQVVAGKYRLQRLLGAGGMGVVFAAHHLQLQKTVAIKLLRREMLTEPAAVGRFLREARAAVQIENEHVARVLDVGELPQGAPYMVMEFLEGGDLARWLKERGPLPVEQAVDFVLQAAVGVAEAHVLGIVHRDLKPANLFCVRRSDGQWIIKILDFGISKSDPIYAGHSHSVTSSGAVMGSPLYMSPEQLRATKDVDHRTDVWALGVILFELLTDRTPFSGETLPEVAIQVATEPPASIRNFRPDLPVGLERVILRCLEKQMRARYSDVSELARALLPFGSPRAQVSVERISGIIRAARISASALETPTPFPSRTASGAALASETLLTVGQTSRSPARKKTAARRIGTLSVVGLAAAASLWAIRRSHPISWNASSTSATSIPVSLLDPRTLATAPLPAMPSPASIPSAPTSLPASAMSRSVDGKERSTEPETLGTAAYEQPVRGPSSLPSRPSSSTQDRIGKPPSPMIPAAKTSSGAQLLGAAPQSAARPLNCSPPYTIDANGYRHYKPECP